ncbi:MAG: hypothetical protein E4H20_09365, partial [Spirochaetales bacterium]
MAGRTGKGRRTDKAHKSAAVHKTAPSFRRWLPFAIVLLGLAAIVSTILITVNAPLKVALVGLDEREQSVVRDILGDGSRYLVVEQGPTGTAAMAIKADLAMYRAGVWTSASVISSAPIPVSLLNATVPSLRAAATAAGTAVAMPLFLDHFELAWQADRLSSIGLSPPWSIAEMERAMAVWTERRAHTGSALERSTSALAFAGGDDETLLLFLSALCLSEGGWSAYSTVRNALIGGATMQDL